MGGCRAPPNPPLIVRMLTQITRPGPLVKSSLLRTGGLPPPQPPRLVFIECLQRLTRPLLNHHFFDLLFFFVNFLFVCLSFSLSLSLYLSLSVFSLFLSPLFFYLFLVFMPLALSLYRLRKCCACHKLCTVHGESAAPAAKSAPHLAKVLRLPRNPYLTLRKCYFRPIGKGHLDPQKCPHSQYVGAIVHGLRPG